MSVVASHAPSALALAAHTVQHSFGKLFSRFHWTAVLSSILIVFMTWLARAREAVEVLAERFGIGVAQQDMEEADEAGVH